MKPCRFMRPLHLFVRALDGGDRGTPVVTQYTEGHPCAGAAHSYKPILVSREDSLTWARKGSLCYPVSPQPKGVTWARWGPSCHPVSSQPLTISREENGHQCSRMGVHLELHCGLGDVEDTQCAIAITCCHVLLLWVSIRSRAPSEAEATLGTPSGERSALP